MSQLPPQLTQYPGYYPAGTKKFWTRTKVGAVTGLVGLALGFGLGAPTQADTTPKTQPPGLTQADLDAAVDSATSGMGARLEQEEDEAAAAARKAADRAERQQARAVKTAVVKARQEERTRAKAAIEKARREATRAAKQAAQQAARESAPAPQPLASTGGTGSGGTDPRFSYCYEANDAGYGPDTQGRDPEYDWYDGVVCET